MKWCVPASIAQPRIDARERGAASSSSDSDRDEEESREDMRKEAISSESELGSRDRARAPRCAIFSCNPTSPKDTECELAGYQMDESISYLPLLDHKDDGKDLVEEAAEHDFKRTFALQQ